MAERSLDKEFDQLRNDLGTLRNDVASLTRVLAKKSAAEVDKAMANGRAHVDAGIGVVEDQVVAHPLSSLLIAFGAGVLLAKLTHSR